MKTQTLTRILAAAALITFVGCGSTPPAGDPGDCAIDRDCTEGAYCSAAGRCAQDCALASDCGDGELCTDNGRCEPDGEGACAQDSECRTPPDGATTTCEGDDLVTSGYVGTCVASACNYEQSADAEVRVTCDHGCDAASNACLPPDNPCAGVTCTQPPEVACKDADTLYTFAQVGMCVGEGDCDYQRTEVTCPSGCENGACNQGTCDGVQCGTPPQPSCDSTDANVSVVYAAVGMCVDNAGAPECQYDTTRTNCAYLGGNCDSNSGTCDNAKAQSGEIVITEYMGDPAGDQDAGEWIELLNTTGADINLNGWRLRSEGPGGSVEEHVIGADVTVPAGGYVMISNGADPLGDATAPAYVYGDVSLFFVDFLEVVKADGSTSDFLYWEGGSTMSARSRKIGEASAATAAANDEPSNWCSSLTDPFGPGGAQFGTPAAANTSCAIDPCTNFDCGTKPAPTCDGTDTVIDYGLETPVCRPTRFNNPFCDFQQFEANCDNTAGTCLAGVCEAFPTNLPTAGQVIITEIMGAPDGSDTDLEWIELYNTTNAELPLFSLKLEDNEAGNLYSFSNMLDDPTIVIPANGYAVLATSIDSTTNGGITGAIKLKSNILKNSPPLDGNGTSTMKLRLVTQAGTLIDEAYYGTPTEGASQQMSSTLYVGIAAADTENDSAAGFCDADAAATYGATPNLGTPGAENIACPAP